MGVILSLCNINFNNLFCMTYIAFIFLAEQFRYTSIPYLILEYMNEWYNSLANLFVTLYLILLKIPKYLISDLPKHSTCNNFIQLFRYWLVCRMEKYLKLVLSPFIVNLFLTHHKYNSLNFDTTFDIMLIKFLLYINRAALSANSLIQSCPTARYISLIYNENSNGPNTDPCGTHILHHLYRIQHHYLLNTVY